LSALCLLAFTCWPGLAAATNYSLWVNGRTGGGVVGNYDSFNYFGPATVAAGINKKSANWDGRSSIASQSGTLRNALDCFCTGANWCYIATHSAGDLLVGYTLANYGGSARPVTAAKPNGAGICGAAVDARHQTGWNIKWVRSAAGSAGGSELADAGAWAISEPLVQDQRVATARAMYNHNDTHNVWFYMYAGARGTLYSFLLPGQDDEVIAYHSAGAVSGSGGGSYCNPRDWFCNDLTLGVGPVEGGRPKWAFHSAVLRDDGENYRHYTGGNWDGITAPMRRDMELFAQ
jgi:hypothetical protein